MDKKITAKLIEEPKFEEMPHEHEWQYAASTIFGISLIFVCICGAWKKVERKADPEK